MNLKSILPLKKFKRGQEYIYNGETVYIYHHRDDGKVVICNEKPFVTTSTYTVVELGALSEPASQRKGITVKQPTQEKITRSKSLNEFYNEMAELMPFHCQNCGKPLYAHAKFFKRCVTAHIFPKAEFKSIETNPDNILFLGWGIIGVCFCHDDWDRKGADHRQTMNIYPMALERFEKLKPCMTDHEVNKAMKYLNIKP